MSLSNQRYSNPQHKTFRQQVLKNAGHRCQYVEHGKRCTETKVQAHHIKPIRDGGTYDPWNGLALCQKHHEIAEKAAGSHRQRQRPQKEHPGWGRSSQKT